MRVNTHAHIFNFKSVLTLKTLEILLNRIAGDEWPAFVIDAIRKVLTTLINGKDLNEEDLLRQFVQHISASTRKIKGYSKKTGKIIPGDLALLLKGDIVGFDKAAVNNVLQKLGDFLDEDRDARKQTFSDLLDFLAIGMKPTISAVAKNLMKQSGNDTVVVTLMMDITTGGTANVRLFRKQLEDTSRAALAYPGRLLPFVAVNTLRATHYSAMDTALTTQGFVGVKLYPSLGYEIVSNGVISPKMEAVFTYCETNEIPVLVHCNDKGFCLNKNTAQFSDPFLWNAVLEKHKNLKICFGHFGGGENFVKTPFPTSWTQTIITLMKNGNYPGVYADIAYHTDQMAGGMAESNYFNNLSSLLNSDPIKDRILFGSDYFLVRQRLHDHNYWNYFRSRLRATHFDKITKDNPSRFLGLPTTNNPTPAKNIQQYLAFLKNNKTGFGAVPADWVKSALNGIP